MQVNVQVLSKKAIDAALKNNWEKAIQHNQKILEKNPEDKNSKIRLGRAYIKVEKFNDAKKIFEEILEEDPINSVAMKNYKLASENNPDNKGGGSNNHNKVLIKEPGTTAQVEISAPENILSTLEPGQPLCIRSYKTKICFFTDRKKGIGSSRDVAAQIVYKAKRDGKDVTASVIKPNKDHFTVLLKCKTPIFKSEKQQEKPYMKTSFISEPEIKIPELENREQS